MLNRDGAAALDALAKLAVYDSRQAFAVAAVLDNHGGNLELYIAGDTEEVPPIAVDHLKDICARLITINAAIEASPNRGAILHELSWNPHNPSGSSEPAFTALRELELSLYRYSGRRILARMSNTPEINWPNELSHLIACIKGAPANTRDDMSFDERYAVENLQESERLQQYLPRLDQAVVRLQKLVNEAPDVDLDDIRLRRLLVFLDDNRYRFVIDAWYFDKFISGHITRTTGTTPHPRPDMLSWLRKVTSVTRAFRALIRALAIPAISALFRDSIPVHPVTNIPHTADNIEAILATAAKSGRTTCDGVCDHPHECDGLFAKLVKAAARSAAPIHCDCAILAHLWEHDQPMLPYVGLSDPPCMLCAMFFAACRDRRGRDSGTITRVPSGKATASWLYPKFSKAPDHHDAPVIQKYFRRRLCACYTEIRALVEELLKAPNDCTWILL